MSPPVRMITIEEVKAAQRSAPLAAETKAMQREYDAQRSAAHREARAAIWRAERAAEAERFKALTESINRLRLFNAAQLAEQGRKLVAIPYKTAAYYGMAPKVAGGWVAVKLPFGDWHQLYAAVIPLHWTEGRALTAAILRDAWLEIAIDRHDLGSVLHFLSDLAAPSDLEVEFTPEDLIAS